MKLPILSSLLIAATLLQVPAYAQIRPEPRPGDRRNDQCDPRRYDCRDERGGGHHHGGGGGIRPPERYPDYPPYNPPRRDPAPRPYPDRPDYPNYPDYPHNNYGESRVEFYSVTRRTGGEWMRVNFSYPSYIDYVRLDLSRAALRVHEAYAITRSGRRLLIRNLSYASTFYPGQSITSEYITAGERVVAIDIRAESMGGYADMEVTVTSSDGAPSIYPTRY